MRIRLTDSAFEIVHDDEEYTIRMGDDDDTVLVIGAITEGNLGVPANAVIWRNLPITWLNQIITWQ